MLSFVFLKKGFDFSNLRNRTEAESLNYKYDELWETHYLTYHGASELLKCHTLTLPGEIRPSIHVFVSYITHEKY